MVMKKQQRKITDKKMLQKRNFTFVKCSQMSILKIKFDFQSNVSEKM